MERGLPFAPQSFTGAWPALGLPGRRISFHTAFCPQPFPYLLRYHHNFSTHRVTQKNASVSLFILSCNWILSFSKALLGLPESLFKDSLGQQLSLCPLFMM